MSFDERVTLLNKYIKEWFEVNDEIQVKPKDLMPYLIDKGIYLNDNKKGNPLRKDLRKLKSENNLNKLNYLEFEEKGKNTYWYFRKK